MNKTKQFAQLIKKLVKEEVQKQVRKVLNEQASSNIATNYTDSVESSKPAKAAQQRFTTNDALNDILNETVQTTSYETLKTFDASDARAGFAAMQTGASTNSTPIPDKDVNGAPLNPNNVSEDVMKALTRDYSDLVKRFK